MNPRKPAFFILITVASQWLWATAMGDLAAQMKAGEWRELPTVNLLPTISGYPGGASGSVLPYAQNGLWDPKTQSFYFVGSDHQHSTGYAKFITYSAQSNTWREFPRPSWFVPLTSTAMHGYDHNAIDAGKGILYFMEFCCPVSAWKYVIKDSIWTQMPDPNLGYQRVGGFEYFPELGGLIFAEGGSVYFFNEATGQWTTPLATGLVMGTYCNFAEYNPVHHIMVFGGGNGSSALYKLDASKKVTKLTDAPAEVGALRINWNIFTVDPVSGDYLVFGGPNDSGTFYTYNVVSDIWTKMNQTVPFFLPQTDGNAGSVYRTVATPVSTYGVTMFVKWEGGGKVYLYKHSSGNQVENKARVSGQRVKLTVLPNPFRSGSILKFEGSFPASAAKLRIYNSQGRLVHEEKTTSAALREGFKWDNRDWTNGIYVFTADFGIAAVKGRAVLIK